MYISTIKLNKFTAFEKLSIELSPGLNIFIGTNGTGKTHIMKTAYAACEASDSNVNFIEKLNRLFLPSSNIIGRLVKRHNKSTKCEIEIEKKKRAFDSILPIFKDDEYKISTTFSNHIKESKNKKVSGLKKWVKDQTVSIYIPPKDMLSNAPGFLSLYDKREIHFEEYYVDILRNANLPLLKGPLDKSKKSLLEILQKAMDGKVSIKNEEFFLTNKQGNLEFTLLAEGLRKLGLLWILIRNGSLTKGSILFWDEPEANLNPTIIRTLSKIILELQRLDIQIFIATHDYVFLKEIDLQKKKNDSIFFHSLYRNKETKEIECRTTDKFSNINPNAILDTFSDLYDKEIQKALEDNKSDE